jgi:hypothetical protein
MSKVLRHLGLVSGYTAVWKGLPDVRCTGGLHDMAPTQSRALNLILSYAYRSNLWNL